MALGAGAGVWCAAACASGVVMAGVTWCCGGVWVWVVFLASFIAFILIHAVRQVAGMNDGHVGAGMGAGQGMWGGD